jgi:hypothetical protein
LFDPPFVGGNEPARGAARDVHASELSVYINAPETALASFDYDRCDSGRDAAADWIRSRSGNAERRSLDSLRHPFLWQFPHFYAISWMYREDFASAGIRTLPADEPDGESTARRIVLFSWALTSVSLLPRFFGDAGNLLFENQPPKEKRT